MSSNGIMPCHVVWFVSNAAGVYTLLRDTGGTAVAPVTTESRAWDAMSNPALWDAGRSAAQLQVDLVFVIPFFTAAGSSAS